jgi:hypothetical protein
MLIYVARRSLRWSAKISLSLDLSDSQTASQSPLLKDMWMSNAGACSAPADSPLSPLPTATH